MRPQGRHEAGKQARITMNHEPANPKPPCGALGKRHLSLHQNGLVYGKGGMFLLEPEDVLICCKQARQVNRTFSSFFNLVTSDHPFHRPPHSLSNPQQDANAGNGGGVP